MPALDTELPFHSSTASSCGTAAPEPGMATRQERTGSVPTVAKRRRVAVLGGGPAGAFCALWLCHLSAEAGGKMDVVIFDHKSFGKLGPAGCNMCAGVIPHSLVRNMSILGMELPERVIQRRINGCYLETRGGPVDIPVPDGTCLYATFRGPGPLGVYPAAHGGFDWYLLDQARRRGAVHESRLVTDVHMPPECSAPYTVACSDGFTMEADIVVGAFGVNSNLVGVFERLGFGYRSPRTLRARQAEMPLAPESMRYPMRDRMMIFAMGWPSIRYAAITPKRHHVTVTLIGESLSRRDMEAFLASDTVRKHFPPGWAPPSRYCSCAPQLPTTAARSPIHDRLVVIGDAHTSRYLKNGIESSFYTAMWAARAIAADRTSVADLRKHYLDLCCRAYVRDNVFGRLLLRAHDIVTRSSVVAEAHMEVARQEQATAAGQKPLTDVLWGTFTGSMPYRRILVKAAHPRLQLRLGRALLSSARRQLRQRHPAPRPRPRTAAHRARPPGRIVVIGGGPAGTACAITLARGAGGRSGPEVVLLEEKQFGEQQNQCAGVLSPPGSDMIAETLGTPLPGALLQRRIEGYVLHGERSSIHMDGRMLGECPDVLRRVELDRILLQRAKECGVRVMHTRATDVELIPGGAVVYTDSGSVSAEGVVGAFALDDTMARAFSRHTRYRPPVSLETMACKIHPAGLDFIPELLGDSIHVFLPQRSTVDFGALIPKGNHIVVIIAGADVGVGDMTGFLALPDVARLLPDGAAVDGFYKGAFPLGPARGLYGDSYVVIGDAAGMVRPFKGKGINSAIDSGRRCAEAILTHGFSRDAFAVFVRSQRHLTGDVWYGRFVRRLVMLTSKRGMLDPVIQHASRYDALCRALFDCISGRTTYREVVLRAEHIRWLPAVMWACLARRTQFCR